MPKTLSKRKQAILGAKKLKRDLLVVSNLFAQFPDIRGEYIRVTAPLYGLLDNVIKSNEAPKGKPKRESVCLHDSDSCLTCRLLDSKDCPESSGGVTILEEINQLDSFKCGEFDHKIKSKEVNNDQRSNTR